MKPFTRTGDCDIIPDRPAEAPAEFEIELAAERKVPKVKF
jgi:hypothetical protein